MKNPSITRCGQGLAALALVSSAPFALADNLTWVAGDGAWENAANWSGGALPGIDDFVAISHTGSVTSSATANVAKELTNNSALGVNAGKLAVTGTVDTFGAVTVDGGAALDAGRIFIQSGGGLGVAGAASTVEVVEGVFNHGDWQMSAGGTLTAESFDNFTTLGIASGATATANSMINHPGATALITGAGSALTIHGDLTNNGNVQVTAGGELNTHSIDNNASLVVDQGRVLTDSQINDGSLKVSGANASYHAEHVVTNRGSIEVLAGATTDIDTVDNHGSLKLDGAHLDARNFNNDTDSSLSLSNGATMSLGEALSATRFGISIDGVESRIDTVQFQQLAGTTFINGGTLGATSEFGVQFSGGELIGHGGIDGMLVATDTGVLNPGDESDATQSFVATGLKMLGGTFAVDLAGTGADEYDLIDVHGDAALGGTLRVALESGYVPILGDAFDIILANSITGAFGTVLLPTLGDGLKFTTHNGGSFFRLEVAAVPLPAPALLLGGALGVLGFAARRRS